MRCPAEAKRIRSHVKRSRQRLWFRRCHRQGSRRSLLYSGGMRLIASRRQPPNASTMGFQFLLCPLPFGEAFNIVYGKPHTADRQQFPDKSATTARRKDVTSRLPTLVHARPFPVSATSTTFAVNVVLRSTTPVRSSRLLFTEYQIDDPATANVNARLAAVTQDRRVLTTRIFQGVGQNRHLLERAVFVNRRRHVPDRAVVPR